MRLTTALLYAPATPTVNPSSSNEMGRLRWRTIAWGEIAKKPQPNRAPAQILAVHDWMNGPHVFGAYNHVPANGLNLPKLLAAPLKETLFFVREAAVTDTQTRMTFNAYKSGLRAAKELVDINHAPF